MTTYICELLTLLIWAYNIELATCYWVVLALSWSIQVVQLLALLIWAYDIELLTFYWAMLALSCVHLHLWAASLIDLSLHYWASDILLSCVCIELWLLLGLHLCCWIHPTIMSYLLLHNIVLSWIFLTACISDCAGGVASGCVWALLEHEIISFIHTAYLSLPDVWAFLGARVL